MKVLVTGSAGRLGEALVRMLQNTSHEILSLDRTPSPFTSNVGSVADCSCVRQCGGGMEAVLHTATLHKPHVVTHSRQKKEALIAGDWERLRVLTRRRSPFESLRVSR